MISLAAVAIIFDPVGIEPVKANLSTSACSTNACPASLPKPVTIFNTPAGSFASSAISANANAVSGVISEGFRIMEQPAANAGATFHAAISMGKFQGMIAAATPIGSFIAFELNPGSGKSITCSDVISSCSAKLA